MDIGSQEWFIKFKDQYLRSPMARNYYQGPGKQAMLEGVKIHISAKVESAPVLAYWILPELLEHKVFHKILADTDLLQAAETDNQRRKFITIYPQTAEQLDFLCEHINGVLFHAARSQSRNVPVGPLAACYPIVGDLGWGRSGYVFVRHGNFKKDDPADNRMEVSAKLQAYMLEDKTEGLFKRERELREDV